MSTWIVRYDVADDVGPRVGIKDLIDVAGSPTTSACRPIAAVARPATRDAACVATIRSAGGVIVGKTNLHEIAFGGTGINAFTGTPINPLDPSRMPGGSSSGSAVAVANGEAEVALGTDTGGSIRTPSACCGTVGLKPTFGRVPLDGVAPLSPSLDCVGPMAATVAGVQQGMDLLDPTFSPTSTAAERLGRFRLPGTHPAVDDAIDAAMGRVAALGVATGDVELSGWLDADADGRTVAFAEALDVHRQLVAEHGDELGADIMARFRDAATISADQLAAARRRGAAWRDEVNRALDTHQVIVTTAIIDTPPRLADAATFDTRLPNVAINLSGHPAIVLPVPRPGSIPTSVQLIGLAGSEDVLIATAAVFEAAVGRPDRL